MQVEKEYVMDVYNQIASSFDNTRGKNYWTTVSNFIQNIKDAQLNILDLGCGITNLIDFIICSVQMNLKN